MPGVTVNSPDWSIQRVGTARGAAKRATARDVGLEAFLTEGSAVAEEFVAGPKAATRGGAAAGALDFSYETAPGETAIVAVRHPSGALTFHPAVESTRRTRGGPTTVRFTIPIRPSEATPATRGIVSQAIKVVIVKIAGAAADKAISLALPKLASLFEAAAWRKKGLTEGWLAVTKATLAAGALVPRRPTSPERSLLFIHGTFSNAAAAFGSLAAKDSDFFERVKPLYGDRIFAFDHFTISRTPEENARMLLEGLPDRTQHSKREPCHFDVITHSRGGLVLRNMVERPSALGSVASRLQLGQAVLVASPNEGTPLATPQRWQDTVGWVANLLELFPENPFTTGAEFVANGLVWMARHASGDLPGLRSMDGDGEFVEALQAPSGSANASKPPSGRYSALVANYNPTGKVLERLLDTGVDHFFGSANDLVVPSEGGWRIDRSGSSFIPGARIGCFGPGGNIPVDSVTHVNFFSRAETARFLATALSGQPQPLPPVDPAKSLPDRRRLRSGAQGIAAPVVASGRPRAGRRARLTGAPAAGERAAERAADDGLAVTVVNGDLTFERLPLVLGHYRASRLTGAERVVNDLIGGAMQRSINLGVYPVAPGTYKLFLNTHRATDRPWQTPRPEAVIVVGLGEEGKLQASDLSYTVRQAVLAWTQRLAEGSGDAGAIELAATLMGSGGSGVSAGQAAQLIVQGVCEANRLLQEASEPLANGSADSLRCPRVVHLRLVELYLDRATEAWSALKMQADASPGSYTLTDMVRPGTGPLRRPLDSGYRGAEYDFISAQTREEPGGESSIAYAIDTKRARTEVRAQATQGRLLRELVATASSNENADAQIGRTLFQLLVPIEMESFLSGAGEVQLELDRGTAGIPWELLDDTKHGDEQDSRGATEPWAIRSKLLRKLRTAEFREQVTDADAAAHALVIGEPECPPDYPRLPGALEEAAAVFTCLAADRRLGEERVKRLFSDDPSTTGPDALTVINTLFERDWRLVHIAGHGVPPAAENQAGGVVLSNGTFLGPNEIRMMRIVPELVFVNCCHLGAFANEAVLREPGTSTPTAYDRARFASGVAEQLINIGVRCVVAAGWAVDDGAATAFAKTFYARLLKGIRFIDAIADARRAAFEIESNTWAAYQCYGDPDWQLVREEDGSQGPAVASPDEFDGVASVSDLRLTLDTLYVQTRFQGYDASYQRERLRHLEQRWKAMGWSASDGVGELFAQAYAEARDVPSAIGWYDAVIGASDGNVSLKALEQHGNLRVRQAWREVERARDERDRLARAKPSSRRGQRSKGRTAGRTLSVKRAAAETVLQTALDSARDVITDARTLFQQLCVFRATAERESLCGSAMKRLALVEAAAGRQAEELKAIEGMKQHYRRALEIVRQERLSDPFYPASNYIAAELALHAGERGWKGLNRTLFEESRESLRVKNLEDPDFWSVGGEIDLRLYEAVEHGNLAEVHADLENSYKDLYTRMHGGRGWGSVYDTADFVLSKYIPRVPSAEKKAARSVLAALKALAAAPAG